MFDSIRFCIGDKRIELYGESFSLGELAVQFMNIPFDEYCAMRDQLEIIKEKVERYESDRRITNWFALNEDLIVLDERMCRYPCIKRLRLNSDILYEARDLTGQTMMYGTEDIELTKSDIEIAQKITAYEDYLENPDAYGGVNRTVLSDPKTNKEYVCEEPQPPIPELPPRKTRALLVIPGNLDLKWQRYKQIVKTYANVLYDIDSFRYTIGNFIMFFCSKVEKQDTNHYAQALSAYFEDPSAYKLVANPMRGTGNYTACDNAQVRYVPRETYDGSGVYKIYQYYEVESLQTLLKMDYFHALNVGYVIRKCEYCGKYFLLKKAYHTKYCDNPAPDNPKYTCAQVGYHRRGIKELHADNPKAQSLRRCYQRIDKDCSRGVITSREKDILYCKAKDLYHKATTAAGVSNDDFEKQLASKHLYALCGIIRKTNPRGRPKKECY